MADRSFDRKLQQLLVRRLLDGQAAETLLAELKVRLGDAEAEATLSGAEARVRALQARKAEGRGSLSVRVLTGIAYGWTALLVVQNLTIIWTATRAPGLGPEDADQVRGYIVSAALKIMLLGAGFLAFNRWRTIYSTLFYVLAVLYAFPFGVYIDRWLAGRRDGGPVLLTLSALCSYAAAGLLFAAYWQGRRGAPQPVSVEAFD